MIGSLHLARNIYDIYHDNETVPREWEYIGSGSTRSVYLGPDGIVYKLCHDDYSDWNVMEHENARYWHGKKTLQHLETTVPKTSLYYVESAPVIAMEHFPAAADIDCYFCDDEEFAHPCTCRYWGQARICIAVLCDRLEDLGIGDMFSGNIHYGHDKMWHIIDLGSD